MWHNQLICFVERIEYDFDTKQGKLWMKEGDYCNMPACVKMFQALDPNVNLIITYSGEMLDTGYRLMQDGWVSMDLRQAA